MSSHYGSGFICKFSIVNCQSLIIIIMTQQCFHPSRDVCTMSIDLDLLARKPACLPQFHQVVVASSCICYLLFLRNIPRGHFFWDFEKISKVMACASDGSDHRHCCSHGGVRFDLWLFVVSTIINVITIVINIIITSIILHITITNIITIISYHHCLLSAPSLTWSPSSLLISTSPSPTSSLSSLNITVSRCLQPASTGVVASLFSPRSSVPSHTGSDHAIIIKPIM